MEPPMSNSSMRHRELLKWNLWYAYDPMDQQYYKQAEIRTLTLRTFFLKLYGAPGGVLKKQPVTGCDGVWRGETAIFHVLMTLENDLRLSSRSCRGMPTCRWDSRGMRPARARAWRHLPAKLSYVVAQHRRSSLPTRLSTHALACACSRDVRWHIRKFCIQYCKLYTYCVWVLCV
jgi:hypothetical protein